MAVLFERITDHHCCNRKKPELRKAAHTSSISKLGLRRGKDAMKAKCVGRLDAKVVRSAATCRVTKILAGLMSLVDNPFGVCSVERIGDLDSKS